MLKVVKINPVIKEKIEVDQYIPIKIRWSEFDSNNKKIIYWRTGDIKKSMLEFGISAISGEIRSLTIVFADKISFALKDFSGCNTFERGTPVFDVSSWIGKRTVDDRGLFEVHYCNEKLYMIISENSISKELISGRVSFGLDAGMNICRISVNGLSNDEKFQIKDTLEYIERTSL